METQEIKAGDIVVLKSGSPLITVQSVAQTTDSVAVADLILYDDIQTKFIFLTNIPVHALRVVPA